jgi:sulfide:quinone oxidoreductase
LGAGKAFGDILAVCVMDTRDNGVIILADKMLPPRKHGLLIPGPQAHAMKLACENFPGKPGTGTSSCLT